MMVYGQLQKLAILCNVCFWSTLLFQLWEKARRIPEQILNTIVILGISALVVNIVTIGVGLYCRRNDPSHRKSKTWIKWVIVVSALAQITWLILTWRFPRTAS